MTNSAFVGLQFTRHILRAAGCAILALTATCAFGQTEYADTIYEASYSGAHPWMTTFYGQVSTCEEFPVDPSVCLGNNDTLLALPTGSWVTVGFTDNVIINAPDQADLFVDEIGPSEEFAQIWISDDAGATFTYFGDINGGTTNALDLEDIGYSGCVNAVKIVGLDNNGCIPGFDVVRIYGITGATSEAAVVKSPPKLCEDSGLFDLQSLVSGAGGVQWDGPRVENGWFDTDGASGEFALRYWQTGVIPECDDDTIGVQITVSPCDCAGMPDGNSVIDSCGICIEATDPAFNISCIPKDVFIPNVFSPNLDGVNDSFTISIAHGLIAEIMQMGIFDRWGNTVVAQSGMSVTNTHELWNGLVGGSPVAPGVYFYLIKLAFADGVVLDLHGDVTVVR